VLALTLLAPLPATGQSIITTRLDDPAAVYLSPQGSSTVAGAAVAARGDGIADDSAALQAAIDRAASPGGGILFLAAGRYRVTRTIFVWRGVRIVGWGATRPVLVLGDSTPGFQSGIGLMMMFTHAARPGAGPPPGNTRVPFPPPGQVPSTSGIADAGPSTFYSAMTNVDVDIGNGNPAAVAIRFHVAQHGYLSHMNFHIGSGLAALTEVGNVVHDVHFVGGRYAILTDNTSPFWQFTVIDSTFEGQRDAAIREHMAQLTLVRDTFRRMPVAIDIDPYYSDQLWVKDSRFEQVSSAVVAISNEKNATTQIGFENAMCANVPVFARFRESSRTQNGPAPVYRVARFNHGLVASLESTVGEIATTFTAEALKDMPAQAPHAIGALPPSSEWIDVRAAGAKGDGRTDDTEAIQKAIAGHRVVYFPSGSYIVRNTITLEFDSVLIALHPATMRLDVPDSTPGFDGVGPPRPVLQTQRGARNIVSGIGINTGSVNPRAAGILWRSGEQSLIDDVQFHNGRPNAGGRLGAQYPSLWVTDGGGGTFVDIWSPDTYAQSGFYVSDTTTPGHVYEISVEHHLFNEIILDRVENWDFNAPQTEEEAATSPEAVSLEINSSKNIRINNYHGYRVTRSHMPALAAVRLTNSSDVHFRNVHVNAESGYGICDEVGCGTFLRVSKFPYENSILDVTHHREIREREFAVMDVPSSVAGAPAGSVSASVVEDAVEPLETGFYAISGATAAPDGTLYFVDRHQQRIFSWSKARGLEVVRHDALDPVNLAVDRSGSLLVQSSNGHDGTVYSFRPGTGADRITVLEPQPAAARPGVSFAMPANVWDNGEFANQLNFETFEYKTLGQMFADDVSARKPKEYVSPDGSLVLPMGRVFRQGPDDSYPGMDTTGWRWSNNLDAYGFLTAAPGTLVYVTSGAENRTYRARMQPDGTLGDLHVFAERGGESATSDAAGNVYVANGEIFVYDRDGRSIGRIDVPERPIQLLFGGADHRTLFILGHHTLYSVRTKAPGSL
jgi:Pectate lyase superfamily protein/SMP-30/Gluconolactonase/LRE-like region